MIKLRLTTYDANPDTYAGLDVLETSEIVLSPSPEDALSEILQVQDLLDAVRGLISGTFGECCELRLERIDE